MTESETSVMLTAEDIATLRSKRGGGTGCLIITAIPCVLVVGFLIITGYLYYTLAIAALWIIVSTVVSLGILAAMYKFFKKEDAKIDRDLTRGQKKIIVAPITGKDIKTRDVTRGVNRGKITSKYYMTVAGREYPMSERQYLTIPTGEFLEFQVAPESNIMLSKKWLKKDGTVVEMEMDV